jgi:hypothetical protein
MEIILMLQPVGVVFCVSSGVLLLFLSFAMGFAAMEENKDVFNFIKKACLILSIIFILSTPISCAWGMYKNVLIYRAINSETATKAIENIDLLMDKFGKMLKDK